jgi:hypothetical protein
VGIHELFHLAVGLLCGGSVVSICIDPNDGGATHVMGLMRQYPRVMNDPYALPTFTQLFWSPSAVATLAAGYVGSAVVGFLLIVRALPYHADGSFVHVREPLCAAHSSPHCCLQSLRPRTAFCSASPRTARRPLDVSPRTTLLILVRLEVSSFARRS